MSFIAAVIQDSPIVFDLDSTINKVEKLTEKAKEKNAELVVFPEAFISAYPKGLDFGARIGMRSEEGRLMYSKYYDSALEFDSKQFKKVSAWTKDKKFNSKKFTLRTKFYFKKVILKKINQRY